MEVFCRGGEKDDSKGQSIPEPCGSCGVGRGAGCSGSATECLPSRHKQFPRFSFPPQKTSSPGRTAGIDQPQRSLFAASREELQVDWLCSGCSRAERGVLARWGWPGLVSLAVRVQLEGKAW